MGRICRKEGFKPGMKEWWGDGIHSGSASPVLTATGFVSVRVTVRCPSVSPFARRILLLRVCCCAPGEQDISVLISIDCCTAGAQWQRRRSSAANASSVTLTVDVGSWTRTCFETAQHYSYSWLVFTCCLQVILWRSIVDTSSALETRTTTWRQARVPWRSKVPGGTRNATTPTWTAPICAVTTHRTLTAWSGMRGLATTTLWDLPRWKSDLFIYEFSLNTVRCLNNATLLLASLVHRVPQKGDTTLVVMSL